MLKSKIIGIPTIFYDDDYKKHINNFFNEEEIEQNEYIDFEKSALNKCFDIINKFIKKENLF